MAGNNPTSLNWTEFHKKITDPDLDFRILELQHVSKILEDYHTITLPTNKLDDFFTCILMRLNETREGNPILDETYFNETLQVLNNCLRYLPIQFFDQFANHLFARLTVKTCQKLSEIRASMSGTFPSLRSLPPEQKDNIFHTLYNKLSEEIFGANGDRLSFAVNILADLYLAIGDHATLEEIQKTRQQIETRLGRTRRPETQKDITHLCEAWAKYAPPEEIKIFMEIINGQKYQGTILQFMVLSNCVLNSTHSFGPYANDLIKFFIGEVQANFDLYESADNKGFTETDKNNFLNRIETSLYAIAALYSTFPEKMSGRRSEIASTALYYLNSWLELPTGEEDIDDEAEDEEDTIIDGENIIDVDQIVPTGGDAQHWKVRKAAAILLSKCAEKHPEVVIPYLKKDVYSEAIANALKDTDLPPKKEAFKLLSTIIKSCGNRLDKAFIKYWEDTMIGELCNAKPDVTKCILASLIDIVITTGGIDSESTQTAFYYVEDSVNIEFVPELIDFIIKILSLDNPIDEFAKDIARTLNTALQDEDIKLDESGFEAISALFYRAGSAIDDAQEEFETLANTLLEIASGNTEQTPKALVPLSVYASACTTYEHTDSAIKAIITASGNINNPREVLTAIAILLVSPIASKLKASIATILKGIHQTITSTEPSIVLRSLWCAALALQTGLTTDKDLKNDLNTVLGLFRTSNLQTKYVCLLILIKMDRIAEAQKEALPALVDVLTTNELNASFIEAAAELIIAYSKTAEKETFSIISKLFTMGSNPQFSKYAPQIASVVGKVGNKVDVISESTLDNMTKDLASNKVKAFQLQYLSELSFNRLFNDEKSLSSLYNIIHKSDDKEVISAAASALGSIAANPASKEVGRLLDTIEKEQSTYSVWVFALKSLTKHLREATSFKRIASVLMNLGPQYPDANKETGKCLAYLVALNKDFFDTLVSKCVPNDPANAVCASAIFFSLQNVSKDFLASKINTIATHISTDLPLVSYPIISVLRDALRFSDLAHDVYEIASSDAFINCAYPRLTHIVQKNYGAEKIEVDIGVPLRCAVFQTLRNVLKVSPEIPSPGELVPLVAKGMEDSSDEVKREAMRLLCGLTKIQACVQEIAENISLFTIPFQNLRKHAMGTPIERHFIKSLIRLHLVTKENPIQFIEDMMKGLQGNSTLQRLLTESQYFVVKSTKATVATTTQSVIVKILSKYKSEAGKAFIE